MACAGKSVLFYHRLVFAQMKGNLRLLPSRNDLRTFSSSEASPPSSPSTAEEITPKPGIEVMYVRGLPRLTIPLPSRQELCLFTLRPISNCVADLVHQIQIEDKGVDRVVLKTIDGKRIASSTTIESLMEEDFDLVINDKAYRVHSPARERLTQEEIERLSDVRNLVLQLYESLHVSEHQLKKERQLLAQLEQLQTQLLPLEKKREALVLSSERRTTILTWTGLGLMAVQFGALARLTWWDYSWDIMEPVTYFITYGTSMAAFAYYVLTRQEYNMPEVRDREFLLSFHKKARKSGLDVAKYNEIKDQIAQVQLDLQRLKDPLKVAHEGTSSLHHHQTLWDKTQQQLKSLLRPAKD